MPLKRKRKSRLRYLLFAVVVLSITSFTYLNLCADNISMFSEYIGEISYSGFNVENMVLPDLHFFENGLHRIMDLILASS